MFGEERGRPEAHVALRAGVEGVAGRTLSDGPAALLSPASCLLGVTQGGHVFFREPLPLLVDEAVARQAGAVVELLPADVARVDAPLPVQPQVAAQHPAHSIRLSLEASGD